mmetsp:Transcript_27526/g.65201  ORF Transcript_27526/g.65201 Transcript_27526/m.65201 type:complete len:102 (+) Transcript_27526:587-892(+)
MAGRCDALIQIATKQAETGDSSDLSRAIKQLSMLKNTFQALDIQEDFMSGLLQGRPDGKEQSNIDENHAKQLTWADELKTWKSRNESLKSQLVTEIAELVC